MDEAIKELADQDGLQTDSLARMLVATRKEDLPEVKYRERLRVHLERVLTDMDEAIKELADHIREAYPTPDVESQQPAAAVPGIERSASSLEAIPVDENGQQHSRALNMTEWLLSLLIGEAWVRQCINSDGRSCPCMMLAGNVAASPKKKKKSSPSSSQSRSPRTLEAEEEQQAEA